MEKVMESSWDRPSWVMEEKVMERPWVKLDNFDSVKGQKNNEGKKGRTGRAEAATVSAFKPIETLTMGPEENYEMATVEAFDLLRRDCEVGPACQKKKSKVQPISEMASGDSF